VRRRPPNCARGSSGHEDCGPPKRAPSEEEARRRAAGQIEAEAEMAQAPPRRRGPAGRRACRQSSGSPRSTAQEEVLHNASADAWRRWRERERPAKGARQTAELLAEAEAEADAQREPTRSRAPAFAAMASARAGRRARWHIE
jgi:hypothetical protein